MSKKPKRNAPPATYEVMQAWYRSEGRDIVTRRAQSARVAGRALTASLAVEPRLLDEPVTY